MCDRCQSDKIINVLVENPNIFVHVAFDLKGNEFPDWIGGQERERVIQISPILTNGQSG